MKALVTNLSYAEVPNTIEEALKDSNWSRAINEEIKALEKNSTWEIVDRPQDKKTMGCIWVFAIKYNSDGLIERYKARLVARDALRCMEWTIRKYLPPVAKINTIRALLSIVANLDWPLHQLDVKNTFLSGDLEEEVYMDLSSGFEDGIKKGKVCRLKKALYGLKQSPRAWFADLQIQ